MVRTWTDKCYRAEADTKAEFDEYIADLRNSEFQDKVFFIIYCVETDEIVNLETIFNGSAWIIE